MITKAELLKAFGAMTVAFASKNEEEIKQNSKKLDEALAEATPEMIDELKSRPNTPSFSEVVETCVKLINLGKEVAQLVARLRGL